MWVDPRRRPEQEAYEIDVTAETATLLAKSRYGAFPVGHDDDRSRDLLVDGYTTGDDTLWIWERDSRGAPSPPWDTPGRNGRDGSPVPLTGFNIAWFVDDATVVMETSLFDDLGGLGRLALDSPGVIEPVEVVGTVHTGDGEWPQADRADDGRFIVHYNVAGVSWGYEGNLDSDRQSSRAAACPVGERPARPHGVVGHHHHDETTDRIAVSFSSGTTPAQLAVIDQKETDRCHPEPDPRGRSRPVRSRRGLLIQQPRRSEGVGSALPSRRAARVRGSPARGPLRPRRSAEGRRGPTSPGSPCR